MNWEAVGAVAEAFGVVTILVSLIYVAIQVRQNTEQVSRTLEAAELAAFERNIDSGNHVRELLLVHPELAQLLLKGLDSYKGLDQAEKFRFDMLMRNMFSGMQGAYIRQLSVAHDPLGHEGSARIVDQLLENRGAREWLEKASPDWRPAFTEFVNERVAAITKPQDESPNTKQNSSQ
jgi:hypothetical protein